MGPVRTFTLDEASAVASSLRPRLAQLRTASHDERFALEQLADLKRLHGPLVLEGSHAESAEAARWMAAAADARRRVGALLVDIRALGADVVDASLGLVEFFAHRGSDLVVLGYREGDASLSGWRPMSGARSVWYPMSDF